jgi:hypothetical protein
MIIFLIGDWKIRYAMQRIKSNTLYVVLLCAFFSFWGCEDPCVALAKDVCRCFDSETEQKSCIQNVEDEAGKKDLTQSEQDVCEGLLDTCTCSALDDGEYALCGMAYGS